MPDTTKGDTKKIEVPPRWRDTANHFLVRQRGPTCPIMFTVTGDAGQTLEIGVTAELARNLAAWLVVTSDTKPVEFLELVNFIKS